MIKFIDSIQIANQTVLLRVDFNVPLTEDCKVKDDTRIRQVLPTITTLLEQKNRIILVSHLGKPKDGPDPKLSLRHVIPAIKNLIPTCAITFVDNFEKLTTPLVFADNEIVLLENIRFFSGEKTNDPTFAKQLASLAEVYVNDAFSVCHREDASIIGVPKILPSYGGLLLKKEVLALDRLIKSPKRPFVAALGGSKISTKLPLLQKLVTLADRILLGGGLANNFLVAKGLAIGQSILENDQIEAAKQLLITHGNIFLLPTDVIVGRRGESANNAEVKDVANISPEDAIFDIGPRTQVAFADAIGDAKTIIWNGPVGYFEQENYRSGTDAIFTAIISNPQITSIIGGGDTLAAIQGKNGTDSISHISTGGGAMLTYIAHGSLPGINALDQTG
jgi:phosphoglycerate kinase